MCVCVCHALSLNAERCKAYRKRKRIEASLVGEEMDQKGEIKLPFHASCFYSSGLALPQGVVHSLTASVLFNEDMFALASRLTGGGLDSPRDMLTAGQVYQWRVPRAMVGSQYGTLFARRCLRSLARCLHARTLLWCSHTRSLVFPVICMGLFRSKRWEPRDPLDETVLLVEEVDLYHPPGAREAAARFVYTNPPPNEVLVDDDLVYVLAMDDFVEDRWSTMDPVTPIALIVQDDLMAVDPTVPIALGGGVEVMRRRPTVTPLPPDFAVRTVGPRCCCFRSPPLSRCRTCDACRRARCRCTSCAARRRPCRRGRRRRARRS